MAASLRAALSAERRRVVLSLAVATLRGDPVVEHLLRRRLDELNAALADPR